MKYLVTLILLCTSLPSNARIHTVLDKKTILNYHNKSPLYTEPIYVSNNIKVNIKHKIRFNRFKNIISDAANKHDVDENLVHAIIQTESAYNPTAVSIKGAMGLMQLMPNTARRFGCHNRNNPTQNINGGTKYLKHLIDLFDSNLQLEVYGLVFLTQE